ncbi:MAG TPA: carboxypeptidase-like regulatory domain-containing protein, partial [Tepidisphaeraceae bacterium]|nr:carboxypeptidase-like regulatory domain-containing protein [Tepidisphaeraceae bacterium]
MRRMMGLALVILFITTVCFAAPPAGHTVTIQVVNKATGDPIVGAEVTTGRERAQTDDYGQCALTIGANQRYLGFRVQKPDFVSMAVAWQDVNAMAHFPDQLTFSMEPGTTIGGIVEDEHGQPVPDATVEFTSASNLSDGKIHSILDANVKTDADGKWSVNTAPTRLDRIWVRATHPGFANEQSYQNAPPAAELRKRTAVITIQHAVAVTGKVLDPAGHPVADAEITAGEPGWWGARHRTRTNSDGDFNLSGLKPGGLTINVLSKDFAPAAISTTAPNANPVEVHLKPGVPMKLHVIDKAGQPIPGVVIDVETWEGEHILPEHLRTDAGGNAVWANAPTDEVEMNFDRRGFGSIRQKPITASSDVINITLGPPTKVHGTVVDATTGQPVKDFTIITGIGWNNEQPISWQINDNYLPPKPGHDGEFTYPVEQGNSQYALRIEAPGYLPTDSRRFATDEGDISLEFKMTKGAWITGNLYGPDRKPLSNARVFIVVGGRQLQIQTHGEIADWSQQQNQSTLTD